MTQIVEKRASTVEDATEAALRELGVPRDRVIIEVLSEGRRGLFTGRSRAHVRATVVESETNGRAQVTQVRQDDEAASTPETGEGGIEHVDVGSGHEGDESERHAAAAAATDDQDATQVGASDRMADLEEESELAADFIEGLLDILELPGDIEIEVDESQAFVNVVDVGSGLLIGRRGATLEALQELVRAATQRQVERRSHVRIDIEGYRQRQLEKLKDRCREGIAQVRETGEPFRLEPMDAYERKVMHELVARTGGVTSASEGAEPRRRVVVHAAE